MNRPIPDSSQEASRDSSAPRKFPSPEGLRMGSWSQCMRKSEGRLSAGYELSFRLGHGADSTRLDA